MEGSLPAKLAPTQVIFIPTVVQSARSWQEKKRGHSPRNFMVLGHSAKADGNPKALKRQANISLGNAGYEAYRLWKLFGSAVINLRTK